MAEEYYRLPDDPVYSAENIRKIRNTDPVNAEAIVNPVIGRLVENTHAVKKQADAADQELARMGEALAGKAELDRETGKLPAAQLPGHTHRTQEVLLSGGTAQALGLRSIVLKNLVANGSFERGEEGWLLGDGNSVSLMSSHPVDGQHGEYAAGGYNPVLAVQTHIAGLTSSHTYYFRMLTATDGVSSAAVMVSVGYTDSPGNSWDKIFYEEGMDLCTPSMAAVSAVSTNLMGDALSIQVDEASGNWNYIDAVMLVDLTEAFGAGKEPGRAWCDENIPYFEDSYAMEESTVDEALNSILFKLNFSVDNIFSQLSPKFSITSVEYIGDGTASKTFTVPGKPLALFISKHGGSASNAVSTFRGMTNVFYSTSSSGGAVTWAARSVSVSGSAAYAGNENNITYTAIIIFEVADLTSEVALTVVDESGAPVRGALVDGIYSRYGDTLITDESGCAKGFALKGGTVTVTADYIDLKPLTFTISDVPDGGLSLTKTLPYVAAGTVKEFTRSSTLKVHKTRSVQLCIIGGGTGGTGGYGAIGYYIAAPGGSGGGPGKALTVSATLTSNTDYDLVCGAGGLGGAGGRAGTSITSGTTPGSAGSAGGSTSFSKWSSENGNTATNTFYNTVIRAGGRGGDGAYNSGSGSAGSNGYGGTGGNGVSVAGSIGSGSSGLNGTRGGGGGGGGGASESNKGVVGGCSGGTGGRGGDGALLIRF